MPSPSHHGEGAHRADGENILKNFKYYKEQ